MKESEIESEEDIVVELEEESPTQRTIGTQTELLTQDQSVQVNITVRRYTPKRNIWKTCE